MSIPQDILKTVGDNPVEGAIAICRFALDHSKESSDWTEEIHGVLIEATAAIMSLQEEQQLPFRRRGAYGLCVQQHDPIPSGQPG